MVRSKVKCSMGRSTYPGLSSFGNTQIWWGSGVGEFPRHHEHVDQRTVAPHRHLDTTGDRVLDHQLLDCGRGDDVVSVDADHDVAAAKTRLSRRAALHDAGDLQPGGSAEFGRQCGCDRDMRTGDAQ